MALLYWFIRERQANPYMGTWELQNFPALSSVLNWVVLYAVSGVVLGSFGLWILNLEHWDKNHLVEGRISSSRFLPKGRESHCKYFYDLDASSRFFLLRFPPSVHVLVGLRSHVGSSLLRPSRISSPKDGLGNFKPPTCRALRVGSPIVCLRYAADTGQLSAHGEHPRLNQQWRMVRISHLVCSSVPGCLHILRPADSDSGDRQLQPHEVLRSWAIVYHGFVCLCDRSDLLPQLCWG